MPPRVQVRLARTELGEVAFEEALIEGREMDFDHAVEYALESGESPPAAP